jgi:hypothetical protein
MFEMPDTGAKYPKCFFSPAKISVALSSTPRARRNTAGARGPQQRAEQADQGIAHICICIVAQGFVCKLSICKSRISHKTKDRANEISHKTKDRWPVYAALNL